MTYYAPVLRSSTAGRRAAASSSTTTALFRSRTRTWGLSTTSSRPTRLDVARPRQHRRRPCALRHDRQRRPATTSSPFVVNHCQGPHGARAQRQPRRTPASCAQELEARGLDLPHHDRQRGHRLHHRAGAPQHRGSIEEAVYRRDGHASRARIPSSSCPRRRSSSPRATRTASARSACGQSEGRLGTSSPPSPARSTPSAPSSSRDIRPGRDRRRRHGTAFAPIHEPLRQSAADAVRLRVSSTSPAPTPSSTAVSVHTSHASARARSSRSSIPCRRTSSSACRIPASMRPSATRASPASPTASALSKTSTSAAPSSRPRSEDARKRGATSSSTPSAPMVVRASASC